MNHGSTQINTDNYQYIGLLLLHWSDQNAVLILLSRGNAKFWTDSPLPPYFQDARDRRRNRRHPHGNKQGCELRKNVFQRELQGQVVTDAPLSYLHPRGDFEQSQLHGRKPGVFQVRALEQSTKPVHDGVGRRVEEQ